MKIYPIEKHTDVSDEESKMGFSVFVDTLSRDKDD